MKKIDCYLFYIILFKSLISDIGFALQTVYYKNNNSNNKIKIYDPKICKTYHSVI